MVNKFTQYHTVESKHLDELNHVNNIQYLHWSQEIAKAHWESLIASLETQTGIWMVRNHRIEYRLEAKEKDIIRVETHVNSVRGPLSNRVVSFYNNTTQKLLVHCQTQWCYIDLNLKKALTIPSEIEYLFLNKNKI